MLLVDEIYVDEVGGYRRREGDSARLWEGIVLLDHCHLWKTFHSFQKIGLFKRVGPLGDVFVLSLFVIFPH